MYWSVGGCTARNIFHRKFKVPDAKSNVHCRKFYVQWCQEVAKAANHMSIGAIYMENFITAFVEQSQTHDEWC